MHRSEQPGISGAELLQGQVKETQMGSGGGTGGRWREGVLFVFKTINGP